jgi:TatD DNase family protein
VVIDSHCHLADTSFATDLDVVAGRARDAGVESALCILSADEPDEVQRSEVVRSAWPAIQFAAAIHPHRAGPYHGRASEAAAITAGTVERVGAVAVGEIGLDYHYNFAPRPVQQEVFAAQIAAAVERRLPVVIHTREAFDDTLAILREAGAGRATGVMHCFSGTASEAARALDLGFYISLSGIVTFPKAGGLRDLARTLPEDRILVETDAPFLAPVPHRGKRNEPAWVVESLRAVADARSTTAERLGDRIRQNFLTLIGPNRVPLQELGGRDRVDTPPTPMV